MEQIKSDYNLSQLKKSWRSIGKRVYVSTIVQQPYVFAYWQQQQIIEKVITKNGQIKKMHEWKKKSKQMTWKTQHTKLNAKEKKQKINRE